MLVRACHAREVVLSREKTRPWKSGLQPGWALARQSPGAPALLRHCSRWAAAMAGRRDVERILRERTAALGEEPLREEAPAGEARPDASQAQVPLDVSNAIGRLLEAFEDKDYFRCQHAALASGPCSD